jgi:hypothetical protein
MRVGVLISVAIVLAVQSPAGTAVADSGVKVSADFRYRHETISVEDEDARNRHRIRARAALQADATDWAKFRVRIVTGSVNPTTLMQTLDGGFSDKPLSLDLAYLDMALPTFRALHILGGKMPYPFKTTPLVWDGDVTPEGLALKFSHSLAAIEPMVNAGFFWVEERAGDDDSYLIGAQAGAKIRPLDPLHLMVFCGLSQYSEAKDRAPFFDSNSSKGNSVDSLGNYMYDFTQAEAYAEIGIKAGVIPVTVFANYVTNTGVDSLNGGLLLGLGLGKASEPNSWQIKYDYRTLERDAVIGAFTDSDPWTGGTDGENHKVHAVYQLATNTQLGLICFMGTDGLEDNAPTVTKVRAEVNLRI